MGIFRLLLKTTTVDTPGFSPISALDLWVCEYTVIGVSNTFLNSASQVPSAINNSINDPNGFDASLQIEQFAAANGTFRFNTNGASIVLDNNFQNPIDFNTLPAGFTITSARVNVEVSRSGLGAGDTSVITFFLQKDASTEDSGTIIAKDTVQDLNFPYSFASSPFPTMMNVVYKGCGIRSHSNLASVPGSLVLAKSIYISGTYEIQQFKWKIIPPSSPVSVGDPVTITGTDGLKDITKVIVQTVDGSNNITTLTVNSPFVSQTDTELTFDLPNFGSSEVIFLSVEFDGGGTSFKGSVSLGALLTINYTNPSGVYQLVVGKFTDTLYVRDSNTTIDVKIPDPDWKTGFVNG